MARLRETCSRCPALRDRPGQALCKKCHAKYMKDWRGDRVYVKREDLQRLEAQA